MNSNVVPGSLSQPAPHTPTIAFRHLPPRKDVVNQCLEFDTHVKDLVVHGDRERERQRETNTHSERETDRDRDITETERAGELQTM